MRFSPALRVTLLLFAAICFISIAILLSRVLPGRSALAIILGGVVVVCSVIETFVVAVAAYRLVRYKVERLPLNIASTLVGAFAALPFLTLWYTLN